jgi:hypothetical protein
MGLMAYDPIRLAALGAAAQAALDDLQSLRCRDPEAAQTMLIIGLACRTITELCLPRIHDILNSDAMTGYHSASVEGGPCDPLVLARSKSPGWRVSRDPLGDPPIPTIGAGNLVLSADTTTTSFDIPIWKGHGVTRIQFFIDDEEVCISGTGPNIGCGFGDARGFANGAGISDYDLPARVRIVLNHETGEGLMVAYPTHDGDGSEVAALPIDLTVDGPTRQLPDDYPSQLRLWTRGDGIDGNIVFDYRLLNSKTPELVGGLAPAINGAVRLRQGPNGTVTIDGRLAQYPSVEIIRDEQLPNGYKSTLIFTKAQESGGPLNLIEPGEKFAVSG